MTRTLHIELLGGLSIRPAGEEPLHFAARRAEILLAYLALTQRSHERETLATLLWDDREQKQALANLRSLLAQLPPRLRPYLDITRKTLALQTESPLRVDALEFEQALKQLPSQARPAAASVTPEHLEEALQLYRGPFLEGVFVRESRGLEEWMAVTRERLQGHAIRAHRWLANHYLHHRRYEAGLPHAQAIVQMDPLGERGQRLLMRLLARNGQTAAALAQFERCRLVLAEELGVPPAAETERLYQQIRRIREPIPHRLPSPLTPFVGRREELAMVSSLLDDPDCRLLTVIGVGGAGKTRLAIQAAAERRGDYWHGVYFVPLAGVQADGDGAVAAVAQAIAAALNLNFEDDTPAQEQVLAHVAQRELLLVLDNVEHLVAGATKLVAGILGRAPNVQLLVTSRERLRLQAEWLLTLEGLGVPAAESDFGPRSFSDAEKLFQHTARRMRRESVMQGPAAATVRHICRLLEGLPLAIELAAGSLLTCEPQEVAAQIRRNLDFLSGDMRDAPARQRSLRAAFDHSWALLDERARSIMAQLSVFRGEFDTEAAGAVAEAPAKELEALCARSMLRAVRDDVYAMHEALRPYAAEKLAAHPQAATAARLRHARYYGRFLQQWADDLGGGERQLQAVEEVNDAWDNVAAGWRRALAAGEIALLDRYLPPLNQWLTVRGRYHEGLTLYEAAAGALREDPVVREAPLLGRLLACLGFFQYRLTALEKAEHNLQESVALLSRLALDAETVRPLGGLANVAFRRGNYEQAKTYFEQALAVSRRLQLEARMAASLEGLALVANFQGDLQEALRLLRESLALHRQVGDRHAVANALGNLAATMMDLGNPAGALPYYEESVDLWRQLGDDYTLPIVLENMGEGLLKLGRYDKAQTVFEEALQIGRRQNVERGYSHWGLAEVHFAQGAYEQAQIGYRQALAHATSDYQRLRALAGWSRLQAQQNRPARAATYLQLVADHPATPELDREAAQQALDAALAQLSPREQATIHEARGQQSLDEAVTAILGKHSPQQTRA